MTHTFTLPAIALDNNHIQQPVDAETRGQVNHVRLLTALHGGWNCPTGTKCGHYAITTGKSRSSLLYNQFDHYRVDRRSGVRIKCNQSNAGTSRETCRILSISLRHRQRSEHLDGSVGHHHRSNLAEPTHSWASRKLAFLYECRKNATCIRVGVC